MQVVNRITNVAQINVDFIVNFMIVSSEIWVVSLSRFRIMACQVALDITQSIRFSSNWASPPLQQTHNSELGSRIKKVRLPINEKICRLTPCEFLRSAQPKFTLNEMSPQNNCGNYVFLGFFCFSCVFRPLEMVIFGRFSKNNRINCNLSHPDYAFVAVAGFLTGLGGSGGFLPR